MTKTEFMEAVAKKLGETFSKKEYTIQCNVFTKNNNTRKNGIVIQKKGEIMSPTIYVDSYYDDFLKKKVTVAETAELVTEIYNRVHQHAMHYSDFSIDFETCQSQIIYRLISQEMNRELLEQVPYVPFLNLAITFSVVCEINGRSVETLRVTNDLMQKWDCTIKDLMKLAEQNTAQLFPVQIDSLTNVVFKYMGIPIGTSGEDKLDVDCPMLILTNTIGVNGATSLLYQHVIQELSEKYDSNLYILPSSIHEVIVIPDESAGDLSSLTQMVMEINEQHVDKEEILSNNAYYYDRVERRFIF